MAFKDRQKRLRLEMLALMTIDPKWHEKPETELYKQITTIGQQLIKYSPDYAKRTINEEEYHRLRSQGVPIKQIASHLNISSTTLHSWRKEKGFI
ncbi:hypothetical protein [Enterococcus termitis]|uniref:Uncharacterized protein n=1 Tax=Enterococcus termitis TaxID=332950 RepID=A0A1E5H1D5_9ENTE|nr:hypothetical protein [Enterococcus termitis]OEG18713.1 hypothetical protein BCR25_16060 [Enterococcus termitis]OJG97564.1 hypothetical protein RV18_GL000632 [Enterococcus termitis]